MLRYRIRYVGLVFTKDIYGWKRTQNKETQSGYLYCTASKIW